ncbi:HAD-IA family hydrolase [Streptococcus sp. 121]|uniref:HAD family hydrolase n=1 Tax=Streptococcus sp. 121 TaxID=2797637 RepID=UPI0018F0878B|nr:HAD-IA family hydrolase [Streptococcus sp. 121]MBJ6746535.1 HAD-IA family hydrolase [Streptococcus sp. 121]
MVLEAIIFDMDGVIVDTEYFDFKIQKDFILKSNPNFSCDESELLQLVGKSYNTLYKLLQNFIGDEFSISEIEEEYTKFSEECYRNIDYQKLFRRDIEFILKFAKANNMKLAVASSSRKQHIIEVLEACHIYQYFDYIESGENFSESKPNPEIYYSVLKDLSVVPENCIALEDSYSGIEAATGTGIPRIGYYDERLPIFNSKASWKVDNMRQAFEIISSL